MDKSFDDLRSLLQRGQVLSRQGSLQRRAPAKAALPYLKEARVGLVDYLRKNPGHAEAWRALSAAEETLLNYPAAIRALERAMAINPQRDRRVLKKLVLLREYAQKWEELAISPSMLKQLGKHLERVLVVEPCDHTLRQTEAWILNQGTKGADLVKILSGFERHGGTCDCEVLWNVIQ